MTAKARIVWSVVRAHMSAGSEPREIDQASRCRTRDGRYDLGGPRCGLAVGGDRGSLAVQAELVPGAIGDILIQRVGAEPPGVEQGEGLIPDLAVRSLQARYPG